MEEALSALDSVDAGPQALCPYAVDALVMLRRPDCRQKCTSPYEPGWHVIDVVSPSTVRMAFTNDDGSVRTKLVNVDVVKPQPAEEVPVSDECDPDDSTIGDGQYDVGCLDPDEPGLPVDTPVANQRTCYNFRDRRAIQQPPRYRD